MGVRNLAKCADVVLEHSLSTLSASISIELEKGALPMGVCQGNSGGPG